jgi:hypothetical protein
MLNEGGLKGMKSFWVAYAFDGFDLVIVVHDGEG